MITLSVLLIKWSLLLAVGWLAHAGLRHRQPRFRLILWRTVLCTGIALPFLQFADLPTLEIQILATPAFSEHGCRELVASPSDSVAPSTQTGASLETTKPIPSPMMESGIAGPEPRQYRAILLWLIWSFGLGVVALRLVRAGVVLGRLRRRSVPGPLSWQLLADEIRREMGIGVPVAVQSSKEAGAPFVCGLFRPAIVLPSKLNLSRAELQVLLRHELAHVRRHDIAWHIAWRWMQAISWFHPLVWPVSRAHHLAAEQEADRIASEQERDPSAYAKRIANIALRVVGLTSSESELALNADSQLVQRLNHLKVSRMRAWGRSHVVVACGISVLMVLVASGWSLVQRQALAAPAPASSDLGSSRLRIIVLDEKGGAVEGAKVQPYAFRVKGPRSVDHYGWDRSTRPTLVTDEKGETLLEYPVEAFPEEKLLTGQISVTVNHQDFSPTTAHLEIDGPAQPIRLQRGLTVEVAGVGPSGQIVPELSANLSGALQAAGPRPPDDRVISVAPQKSELSAEWGERRVIWVVDAMDDPTEFVNEHGDRDAILSLVRAAISRNGSVAMGEFWYRHSQHSIPVEVTISRYPNRQSLDKNWKELSAKFDSKASTKVVGESAAWLQTTEADQTFIQNRILVFRQGLFTGWLDAVAELGEAPLLHLAEAVADKMAKVSEPKVLHLGDKPEALPQSEGRQDRLPAHTTELQAGLLEAGASRTQQAPESPLSVLFLGYTNGMGASVISNQCSRTVKVWAAAWVEVEPFSETRSDDWIWVIGPRDQYLDPGQALYWTFIPPALQGTWRLRIPWSEEDQARIVDWARGRQITDGLKAAPEYYAASAAIKQ